MRDGLRGECKRREAVTRENVQKAILVLAATLAAFCCACGASNGAEVRGRAVKVADGDTITILGAAKAQHKIRLYGIDAPEKSQAFGQKSKQHLSSLVFGKDVCVKYKSLDKYGRILGTVYVDGLDINLEMLRAGLAWHYKRYDNSPVYAAAELEARQNRRGLWADPNPIPPETFRHISSNKRHNRKCENYRKTWGYPCSKDEGTPCGKCGG